MAIQSPQLDDLRYDVIVQTLMRRIPVYTSEWTDWNDSDPGITLIQLFASLAEQVGYRLNQVPEKTYVELLKLLGVRLRPARAASTRIGIFLADPRIVTAYALDAGTRFTASASSALYFESAAAIDITPAQPAVLVTTKNPYLWDLLRNDSAEGVEPRPRLSDLPAQIPAADCRWLTVAWDGAKPAPADMPLRPLTLLPESASGVAHPYLWIGVSGNNAPSAGFAGVSVRLTVQFDDDEVPDPRAGILCQEIDAAGENQPPQIDWLACFDPGQSDMVPIAGRIDDSTAKLTRSGEIAFTLPLGLGPIPASSYANLVEATPPGALNACVEFGKTLKSSLPGGGTVDASTFQTLLTDAISSAQATQNLANGAPAVGHPLDPALRDPGKITCWLRLGPLDAGRPSPKLRFLGFNAVAATNSSAVNGEILGFANGRPGQSFSLAHGDVHAETLKVAVQESIEPGASLVEWAQVESLEAAGPFDRVYELDAESGALSFGDGAHGRVPPLVVGGGAVLALAYRWGGGAAGNIDAGMVNVSAAQSNGMSGIVNFVAAQGGRDAETLDMAKLRARKELSSRSRAVTLADFEWIALDTPEADIRRAIVVPRRRPLAAAGGGGDILCDKGWATPAPRPYAGACAPPGSADVGGLDWSAATRSSHVALGAGNALSASDCGPPLPDPPAGLDDAFEAPGVVTVVAVPGPPNPPVGRPTLVEPVPTPSVLRALCRQLDRHRLVTTEVYVVPPQYMRLCRVYCRVRASLGVTRAQARDQAMARLADWLDALRGGPDGTGAPFGGQVHIADLMAQLMRAPGIDRVEDLRAHFLRTKSNAPFREGDLVLCPSAQGEFDHVDLAAEETTSIDLTSFTLDTV